MNLATGETASASSLPGIGFECVYLYILTSYDALVLIFSFTSSHIVLDTTGKITSKKRLLFAG